MNDKNFKNVFIEHKIEIPDEGFSERIIRKLPERKNILPQIIIVTFIVIWVSFTFFIQGITPIIEQIDNLITSINNLQVPSANSVIILFVLLGVTGIISYSLMQVEEG